MRRAKGCVMTDRRTKAIVLRRTNYGEADRVLKLVTPDGIISAIARGVRREKSKLAGGIELFAVSDVTLQSGRGELDILTSARLEEFFGKILEDYDRLQFGYEAINAVSKASDGIDDPAWFTILTNVYAGLNTKSVPLQLTQAWFYLHYADMTGYELSLECDITGAPLASEKTYMYDVGEKGLRPSEQGDIGADHIKFLRLVAAKPLRTVAQVGGIDGILADCWLLTRQAAAI